MDHEQARSRLFWEEEVCNVLAIFLLLEDWSGSSWSVVDPALL